MRALLLISLSAMAFASGIALERYDLTSTLAGTLLPSTSPDGTVRELAESLAGAEQELKTPDAKEMELALQQRAAYLASLVDEVKQLDRSQKQTGPKSPGFGKEKKTSSRGHAIYKFGGRFEGATYRFVQKPEQKTQGETSERLISLSQSDFGRDVSMVEVSALDQIDMNLAKFSSTPIGSPVIGEITSHFGYRGDVGRVSRRSGFHEGIDISAQPNTPVLATADGIIVTAASKSGYGKTVVVRHRDGLETLYAHLGRIDVSLGAYVRRGQQVGIIGMTGHTTGPHLHYEVRLNGVARNPMKFIDLGSAVTAVAALPVREKSVLG